MNVRQAVPFFLVRDIEASVMLLRGRTSVCRQSHVGHGNEDPDGYQLYFESPTDVPEDTVLEDKAS